MGSVVLDVSKRDGIVDLSLQPHLLALSAAAAEAASGQQPAKKRKKLKAEKGGGPAGGAAEGPLQLGQQLEATVQLVREPRGCPPLVACLKPCNFPEVPAAVQERSGCCPCPGAGSLDQVHTGPPLLLLQAKAEEGYCVVSLAAPRKCDGAAAAAGPVFLGYLPTTDFNLARAPPVQQAHEAGVCFGREQGSYAAVRIG